ncbi:hypothetical protein LOC68_02690 [Blastopirellula sp. JC732]|uniref:Uncharacterized protein n=1 Tax=Blastopirellula sediminis TaxID=2894196 RepID=A0A9X1MIB0_9BACT|nr:hypothetical protein [Blastopirellula sediminis]MCC9607916.1 hypothetical protein [Blastopirellula sediminis]MCC9627291.1 hypothetical protein [Blastopirellula sediminis]
MSNPGDSIHPQRPYSIVSLSLLAVLVGCSAPLPDSNPREITAQLGGAVEDVTGVQWRMRRGESGPTDFIGIDEPISLTLEMSEGRRWQTKSLATFFDQSDGKITSVVVTPLEQPVSFVEAVGIIDSTMMELGGKPGDPAYLKTEEWKRSPPLHDLWVRRSLKTAVADDVELFAEIRPADSGWYLSYTFALIEGPAPDTNRDR